MKTYIDTSTDSESLQLLADLRSLAERAETLSKRFDSQHVAIGKFWGVTRAIREAVTAAQAEIPEEVGGCAGCGAKFYSMEDALNHEHDDEDGYQ